MADLKEERGLKEGKLVRKVYVEAGSEIEPRGEKRSFEREEGVGSGHYCAVVVEAAPCSALEMVEAELAFHLLVVPLDAPAELGEVHEPANRLLGGQVAEPVVRGLILLLVPLDQ